MPKKHTPAYASTKPQPAYVHPALQSSRSPASLTTAQSQPQTVNQRIQQLRREQAPRPTPAQREELTSIATRTVPPELRRILHIPEIHAPRPKAGSRQRRPLDGSVRPPPGPAVPTSWLQQSRHASAPAHTIAGQNGRSVAYGVPIFSSLARVTDAQLKRLPQPFSLVHHCLRTFAVHWEELVEYEQHYLAALPTVLKEALLVYLTVYGATSCLDLRSLKILFQNEEGSGTAGWDETCLLDLTGLLSDGLTLGDVGRCLKRSTFVTDMAALDVTDAKAKEKEAHRRLDALADSWEDEVDSKSIRPVFTDKLQTPHFINLSRLSLARPGPCASWPDLLRISPNLNKITHLSLAYWPRPSTTPNANTTSMVSNHTSVTLGGTHFYSDLDDDWHEAANILRRFSTNTYSLQWLDLEGCNWLKALTWQTGSTPEIHPTRVPFRGDGQQQSGSEWSDLHTGSPGPDWNDAWQRVVYIRVFQGWIPQDSQSLQNMPAGVVGLQLLSWLRHHKNDESLQGVLKSEPGHLAVAGWVEKEKAARLVAGDILRLRKSAKGDYCRFDYGWGELNA